METRTYTAVGVRVRAGPTALRGSPSTESKASASYPAHAAFGGYKQSGIGRENHKMMLDHYQQTKNLLVSCAPQKLGFF
jgi:acyl-CoA reductase-like NAD-dependent aldehyde dehydrogenase